jgi:acylphosphatase
MSVDTSCRFVVSGCVQGVGYRYFAWRAAERLGVRGYVRNRPDGAVEVYAIGPPEQVRLFRDELARGPRAAAVDQVTETPERLDRTFESFDIWH